MPRVLHVIPSLDYSGSAKQLLLLARSKTCAQRICVLGNPGPLLKAVEQTGAVVDLLNWTRPLNPLPLWRLRRIIHEWRPQVIHAWRTTSVRALAIVRKRLPCPCIAQDSWSARRGLGRLDTWLLRRMTRVIARGVTDADWLRARGVPSENIVVVPPGVEEAEPALAGGSRLNKTVVCAGTLDEHKGYYDAIWATDILKYIYDDIHLSVIGDGPDRHRLEHFVQSINAEDYVRFQGAREGAGNRLSEAGVVWVPSRREGGVNVALEAMSRGRPVIASAVGTLGDLITHGETGLLIPPQDKIALARSTRLLFDDPNLSERLATAGRDHVRSHFSATKMRECFSQLYQHAAA